jgi:hypothetical protein
MRLLVLRQYRRSRQEAHLAFSGCNQSSENHLSFLTEVNAHPETVMNISCMNRSWVILTELLAEFRHYVIQHLLADVRQHQIIHVPDDGSVSHRSPYTLLEDDL